MNEQEIKKVNSRILKFRAWAKEEGNRKGHMISWDNPFMNWNVKTNRSNSIWMQYTGLKDKNGVEIYEWDVVKNRWKVRLDGKQDKWKIAKVPQMTPQYFHWLSELEDMEVEVIGNAYETPELLNEKA